MKSIEGDVIARCINFCNIINVFWFRIESMEEMDSNLNNGDRIDKVLMRDIRTDMNGGIVSGLGLEKVAGDIFQ